MQRRINTGDLNDHRKFDSHTLPPSPFFTRSYTEPDSNSGSDSNSVMFRPMRWENFSDATRSASPTICA